MIGGPCDAAIWLGKRKKQSVAAVEGGSVPDGGGSPPSSPTPEVAAQGSSALEEKPGVLLVQFASNAFGPVVFESGAVLVGQIVRCVTDVVEKSQII